MKLYLLYLTLLCSLAAKSQFGGLSSFKDDTILRKTLKKNRVRCVTETLKEDTMKRLNGRYCFDKNGMTTDMVFARGRGFDRISYTYNTAGEITSGIGYKFNDTVHMDNAKYWTLDDKNRIIKEVRKIDRNGTYVDYITYENKYLSDGRGKVQMVVERFDPNIPKSTTIYGRDSVSGVDTFFVSYEFNKGETRYANKKELAHQHIKDFCVYREDLVYNVYGPTETVKEIKGAYSQYDDKWRLLSYGSIEYKDVYMDFMQEHPEDFNVSYYAPVFVRALFDGKIEGKKNQQASYKYNAQGLLTEMKEGEFVYTLSYNTKRQMIKQVTTSDKKDTSVQMQTYDAKGLLIKAVNTYTDENGKKFVSESTYKYSFY